MKDRVQLVVSSRLTSPQRLGCGLVMEPDGRCVLATDRSALLLVRTGHLQVRLGATTADLRAGDVARLAPGSIATVRGAETSRAWWFEVPSGGPARSVAAQIGSAPRLLDAIERSDQLQIAHELKRETEGLLSRPIAVTPVGRARCLALESLDRFVSLEEMARAGGLSRFTLIRQFQRRLGTTPCSYQRALRLGVARRLLADGVRSVRVAHQLGFTDQSHFSRQFTTAFGTTPARFADRRLVA